MAKKNLTARRGVEKRLTLLKIFDMSTYNITLKENISFEQYQMAIKILEAIGVKDKEEDFTDAQKESIMRGLEQAERGSLKPHFEVMENAKKICGL